MLAVSKKTGYGLSALALLARVEEGELVSAAELARRIDAPPALLRNVLKRLAAAGYVESVRGVQGGYRLGREPENVSLRELVVTLEGPIRQAECISGRHDARQCCDELDFCPAANPVHRVQRRLNDLLREMTLAEVLEPAPRPA
jgi:Rrf2 family protein